jgi:tellurite methyltransferase
MAEVQTVSVAEALVLVETGAVRVLDVRSPGEYAELGHIPGSCLIPVELLSSAPAVLGPGLPVLVCCEHGVRSRQAAWFLSEAGLENVLDLEGGLCGWPGPREFGPGRVSGPTPWLLHHARLLPRGGEALDVASGRGRDALFLAALGLSVVALDRDPEAIRALQAVSERLRLPIAARVVDLEQDGYVVPRDAYSVVIVFRYLHRPLIPRLLEAVAPGGILVYETYTTAQKGRGHPQNPDFLLEPGELVGFVRGWEVLDHREGEFPEGALASLVARRLG